MHGLYFICVLRQTFILNNAVCTFLCLRWAPPPPSHVRMLCHLVFNNIINYFITISCDFQVPNYLPTISAATGDFTPQRYIWRIGIALHSLPRFANAFTYYFYYLESFSGQRRAFFIVLNKINTLLHIVENIALLTLTYISSTENYGKSHFKNDSINTVSETN